MCACHGTCVGGRGQLSAISSSRELDRLHTHWVTSPSLWERRDPSTKEAPSPSVCGLIIRPISFFCVCVHVCMCVYSGVCGGQRSTSRCCSPYFFFGDTCLGACLQSRQAPRNLPLLPPHLGLHHLWPHLAFVVVFFFLMWVLGIRFRSSCLTLMPELPFHCRPPPPA